MAEGFASDFKRFFLRGLAAVLPTLITLWVLIKAFSFVDNYLGRYMNRGIQWVVVQFICLLRRSPLLLKGPDWAWEAVNGDWQNYRLSWIGFVLAIIAIYIFGRFVASFIGRGLWRTIERALFRLPFVRQIYPYVKQVTDFVLSRPEIKKFSRVVAVEYPRRGVWSLGLVTAPGMRTLSSKLKGDLLTVFVPSSPTPVTGYTITVRSDEVIDLPISIDDALRYTVSGGVIMPAHQRLSDMEIEQARQAAMPSSEGESKEIRE